jgi:hypothetical protein
MNQDDWGCYEMLSMALEYEIGGYWSQIQWQAIDDRTVQDDTMIMHIAQTMNSRIYFVRD